MEEEEGQLLQKAKGTHSKKGVKLTFSHLAYEVTQEIPKPGSTTGEK